MKTVLKLLFSALLFVGCSGKIVPLKGSYPATPIVYNTEKSFEEVWDKLVDLFAQKGLSIRIIDKSSGLISSGNAELTVTYEDKKGKIIDPSAIIVVPSLKNSADMTYGPVSGLHFDYKLNKYVPNMVYGDWNVRVKKT